MKWAMYLAGIIVGGSVAFFVERARSISKLTEQARQTQVAIQELQALRGEMHATQQELWRR